MPQIAPCATTSGMGWKRLSGPSSPGRMRGGGPTAPSASRRSLHQLISRQEGLLMRNSSEHRGIEPVAADRVVNEVISLLRHSGGEQYFGEPVTKLGHA